MSASEFTIESKTKFVEGDRVKILTSPGLLGKIVEIRGDLGPGGMMVYRLRLNCVSRRRVHIEVREDQLELVSHSV